MDLLKPFEYLAIERNNMYQIRKFLQVKLSKLLNFNLNPGWYVNDAECCSCTKVYLSEKSLVSFVKKIDSNYLGRVLFIEESQLYVFVLVDIALISWYKRVFLSVMTLSRII